MSGDRHTTGMRWAGPLIVVAALVMGLPSLRGGFLSGDDESLVLNSGLVNRPSVRHALMLFEPKYHRDLYQPVPLLSFAAEFAVIRALGLTPEASGPAAGAWLFHLTNVLLHVATALLVRRLVRRYSGDERIGLWAGILFAVHPLAVEPTAWLSGRMVLLSVLFSLAAIEAMAAWQDRPRPWLAALVILLVLLAVASKVQAALPLLMLALPVLRKQRPSPAWWGLWLACLAITVGFVALNVRQSAQAHVLAAAAETLQGSRTARTLLAIGWYFQRFIVPVGLGHFHPAEPLMQWSNPALVPAIFTILAAAILVILSRRRTRLGWVGLAWFLLTIAPTLPLVPSRNILVADRYAYLPNVGLLLAGVALAVYVHSRLSTAGGVRRWVLPVVGAGYILVLLGTSRHVTTFYRSDITLDQRTVSLYPDHPGVWERLAWDYYSAERYSEAIESARRDLERHPDIMASRALQVIGMSQMRLGQPDEAVRSLQRAAQADPSDARVQWRLGQVYERLGNVDAALKSYRAAVADLPKHTPSATSLAQLLRRQNRIDEAVAVYEKILAENSYDAGASQALSEIEMSRGRYADAARRLEALTSWMPDNWAAWTNLGVCRQRLARGEDAVRAYREALSVNPQAVTAALNLGGMLVQAGQVQEAVGVVEQAAAGTLDRGVLWAVHDFLVGCGHVKRADRFWVNAATREPQSADLRAAYAWTRVTAMRWDDVKMALATLAGDVTLPTPMTKAMLALAGGDPAPALQWIRASGEVEAAWRNRFRQALAIYGDANPGNPWTYCLVAELMRIDGDSKTAGMAMQQFEQLCKDAACRDLAAKLGVTSQPVLR